MENIKDVMKLIAKTTLPDNEIDWTASDLRRIYFKDTDLFIRLWNFNKVSSNYTVYEPVEDRAIEVKSGYICYEANEDELIEVSDFINGLNVCKKHFI